MAETMSDAPRATRPGLSPAMRHALIGAARIALGVATVVIVWQAIITLYAVPAFIAAMPSLCRIAPCRAQRSSSSSSSSAVTCVPCA